MASHVTQRSQPCFVYETEKDTCLALKDAALEFDSEKVSALLSHLNSIVRENQNYWEAIFQLKLAKKEIKQLTPKAWANKDMSPILEKICKRKDEYRISDLRNKNFREMEADSIVYSHRGYLKLKQAALYLDTDAVKERTLDLVVSVWFGDDEKMISKIREVIKKFESQCSADPDFQEKKDLLNDGIETCKQRIQRKKDDESFWRWKYNRACADGYDS